MERIGDLARLVLADCERGMKANEKKVSGDLIRPEELSPGAKGREEDTSQAPGIRTRGRDASGLGELCGQVVFQDSRRATSEGEVTTPIACPLPDADTIAGGFRRCASNARGNEIPVAVRVLLGERGCLVLASPAVLIAQNDNRRAHAETPEAGVKYFASNPGSSPSWMNRLR